MSDERNVQDYYNIEVQDMNWMVIVNRLLGARSDKTIDPDKVSVEIVSDQHIMYTVRRDFLSADRLAKAIGSNPEAVNRAPKIVLKALTGDKDWQKPTVDYWGIA